MKLYFYLKCEERHMCKLTYKSCKSELLMIYLDN